jgi:hypothetical protein
VVVGHRVGTTVNWTNYVDLGATHGVVNAAEIEAVGGSSGRAAVGFLGTNVNGDYQANSFPGKWYAFIATTYDGGVTWKTVNATPNDPVQSMTGIWQQGGGEKDRNLLDFNEITIDDKGRVIYGYSDGCVTPECIAGAAPNDFVANLRVARQSGGKTLLASYDGNTDTTTALAPKPPCLSGTRDTSASHLTWKAPDNRGSAIVNYLIFRGTTSGNEVQIGQTGVPKNSFEDTSADPNVAHYFYQVKAVNSSGTPVSNFSNEIDLPISAALLETPCALPGLTILQDGSNDEVDMVAAHDVQKLSIGEPFAFASNKIVFTLKVQSLATVPPETEWPITFDAPDGNNYTVQMTTEAADGATVATPLFQVFKTGSLPPLPAADPASNFTADGTITIIVPRSAIGNPVVGSQLNHFSVRIADATTITPDNMPNNLTPAGSYAIVGNAFCAPNTAPLANLVAHPHGQPTAPPTGDPPITIDFDGSGSSDADAGDTIASYTFDFGDGSAPVTQASPTISHTYTTNGDFGATLKVHDSRGKISSNTGLVDIGVELPVDRVASEKTHGSTLFDVVLYDLSVHPDGTGEVECRTEGTGYTIIYTFGPDFTATGQASSTPTVTNGGNVASHGPGPGAHQYQVHLTGVPNAQFHFITVNGIPVHNSTAGSPNGGNATLNNAAVQLSLLVGDTNADGAVNSADIAQTKSQSGKIVGNSNFREDLNVDGSLNSADIALVKSKSGTALP